MSADEGADNARGFGIHDIGKDRLYEVLRKWLRPVDNKQALVHRPGPARAGPAYRSGLPKYMPPGTVILDQVSPDRENRYIESLFIYILLLPISQRIYRPGSKSDFASVSLENIFNTVSKCSATSAEFSSFSPNVVL